MSFLLDKAAKNLAFNLVQLRRSKNLSQQALAHAAGVTRSVIALLESGSGNPTLDILLKIALGLGISLEELLSAPFAECRLVRAADIPLDRRSRNGVILRKLLPDHIPSTEMDEIELTPGAVLTGNPHVEGTREYFTCSQGQFTIGVLGAAYVLNKGDVLSFPGNRPHSYKNSARSQSRGFSVVFFNAGIT